MRQIDKYARDADVWRQDAEATFEAAALLFQQGPSFGFSAAILGHHALEMLLKAALVCQGFTIANGKPADGYVWGHQLPELARLLASKRPEFPLGTLRQLGRFDAFFDELRYPKSLQRIESLGPGSKELLVLAHLMDCLRPFSLSSSAGGP